MSNVVDFTTGIIADQKKIEDFANSKKLKLKSGGGGGINDDMEARVKRLEDQFEKMNDLLIRVDERSKMTSTKDDINELKSSTKEEFAALRASTKDDINELKLLITNGINATKDSLSESIISTRLDIATLKETVDSKIGWPALAVASSIIITAMGVIATFFG